MKNGRVFSDLLTVLGTAASLEQGLALTLRRLVRLGGATAGALAGRVLDRRAADPAPTQGAR